MNPGTVLMKRHGRISKFEPLVDEVELLHSNIDYAHVKLPSGRETTVSTKHLAPYCRQSDQMPNDTSLHDISGNSSLLNEDEKQNETQYGDIKLMPNEVQNQAEDNETSIRKSSRQGKPPKRLISEIE